MRASSQFLLTFIVNAFWQIALVTALASVCSRLLRDSAARYQHRIWVAALLLSVGLPLVTYVQFTSLLFTNGEQFSPAHGPQIPAFNLEATNSASTNSSLITDGTFLLNRSLALILLAVFAAVLCYGALKLVVAFFASRRLRNSSVGVGKNDLVDGLVEKCLISISGVPGKADVLVSTRVSVPITLGVLRPVIILPESLVREGSEEMLTSAIGHELVHIKRRDYALNFLYEVLYLPLSFHPGAALIRRRIRQTRELACDELVAKRILKPEAYARSLVKLASSAPSLQSLSVITTVGIADADILEARVMSLLKKPDTHRRSRGLLLVACSLLLLVPAVAAAAFATRFDLEPNETALISQEPLQEKELKEKQRTSEVRERSRMSEAEFAERMKNDPKFREELERKRETEIQFRTLKQNALLSLARISMDQAIQIATSQTPGKVMQCILDGEKWKEPGVLDKDGQVFYRVVLVTSEDAANGGVTQVWVNAIDGSVIKTERELPRRRKPE